MFLVASFLAFIVYTVNVAMGAINGTPFLGDVGEMLVLLKASAFFVVAILIKETERNREIGK